MLSVHLQLIFCNIICAERTNKTNVNHKDILHGEIYDTVILFLILKRTTVIEKMLIVRT